MSRVGDVCEQVDTTPRRVEPTNPRHFAGFLAAIGHRVVGSGPTYWFDAGTAFFLSMPSHRLLVPEPDAVRRVLRCQPCLGMRFPAPLDGPGKLSYQIVCDSRDYGIDGLSANARSKVRRGLRRCEVRATSFPEICERGRQADRDTLSRQGRRAGLNGQKWQRYWRAAAETRGMEGWGAYVGEELVAFLVTVQLDDCVEFLLARSRSDRLDAYPNNALIFTVAQDMLVGRGVRKITFGLESLESVGPLEEFKYSMGFRTEALRQRVVFHPAMRSLLGRRWMRAWIEKKARAVGPSGTPWRKVVGLVQFAEAAGELGMSHARS